LVVLYDFAIFTLQIDDKGITFRAHVQIIYIGNIIFYIIRQFLHTQICVFAIFVVPLQPICKWRMKRTNLHTIVLCMLILCSLSAHAERTYKEHTFHGMPSPAEITYAADYLSAVTELTTYTCSGPAGTNFGRAAGDKKIAILLPKSGSTVTTTKIDDLVGLYIRNNPSQTCTNIEVSVSLDSINWIVVSTSGTHQSGFIDIPNIIHDSYYVRIMNTTNTAAEIRSIKYYFDDCNCFRYVSE